MTVAFTQNSSPILLAPYSTSLGGNTYQYETAMKGGFRKSKKSKKSKKSRKNRRSNKRRHH